jgi:hypothetical protein
MRRYLTGTDYGGLNLNSSIEWWWAAPVSPMLVWFIVSVAFGAAIYGTFLLLRGQNPQKLGLTERAFISV